MLASKSALTGSFFFGFSAGFDTAPGGELVVFLRAPVWERIDSKRLSRYLASSLHKSESLLPQFAVNLSTQRSLARFHVFHSCGKIVNDPVSLTFL